MSINKKKLVKLGHFLFCSEIFDLNENMSDE